MNQVTIVVQARNATKAVFDAVRADARTLGTEIGTNLNTQTTAAIKREGSSSSGAYAKAGDTVGQTIGDHISSRITQRIKTSVNDSAKIYGDLNGAIEKASIAQESAQLRLAAAQQKSASILERERLLIGQKQDALNKVNIAQTAYNDLLNKEGVTDKEKQDSLDKLTTAQNKYNTLMERENTLANQKAQNLLRIRTAESAVADAERKRLDVEREQEKVTERMNRASGGTVYRSGASNGNNREKINVDVHDHVSVDVDKKSFLDRISSMGDEAAQTLDSKLSSVVSTVFSGDVISSALKGLSIGGLVTALAPVLGAAITTVVLGALGGGAIGAGILGLFTKRRVKDPLTGSMVTQNGFADAGLEAEMGKLKKSASTLFREYSDNFTAPVTHFFQALPGLFHQLSPMIEHLGKVFGPVTDILQRGIIGFLQNAMPGILRATEKAAPLFKTLGEGLPRLGDAVGKFFDDIGNGGPDAANFFHDLLIAIGLIIRALGRLIEALTHLYGKIRTVAIGAINVFGDILQGAIYAFSWIPGLSPKLAAASDKFEAFRKKVNDSLKKIPDHKDITIRVRMVGANIGGIANALAGYLGGKASGGIIGGAASGGTRSGLTWVGENGPELIDAPAGTRVHSAGDSARIAGGQGGGGMGAFVVQVMLDGKVLAEGLADPMRVYVGRRFGGNVQSAYGR